MSFKAKNRAEVQLVYADGAYLRWTARKDISRPELIAALREFLDDVEHFPTTTPAARPPEEPGS